MNKTTEQELIQRLRKRLQLPVYLVTDTEVLSRSKGLLVRAAIESDIALEGFVDAVAKAMESLGGEFKMAVRRFCRLGHKRGE